MVVTLASAGLLAAFMQTIVTPILPQLPTLLDTTPVDASWVLSATLLTAAVTTPITGRLGDMYGKRRILLVLLSFLAAGSVVAALSNTLLPMIIARVLQGVGMGVIALGISILRDVMHPRNLGGAVALVSATLGIGGGLGLPVAGTIAQFLDWHWLFWLSAILAGVAIVAVVRIIPASTLRTGGRFDFPGAVGLTIGLVALLLAISKGASWGWRSPIILSLLLGGLFVLILWALFELRTRDPLVDLRVASRRPVLLTNLTSITMGFAFFVVWGSLPIMLELSPVSGVGLGLPLLLASLCLMPLGLVMFAISPVAARLSAARGPRTSLITGGIIVTLAFVFGALFLDQIWHVVLVSTVTGLGVGFAYAAIPSLIMRSVPPTETAAANGLNAVMRMLGSALSATLVGVLLATHTVSFAGLAMPTREGFVWVYVMGAGVALVGVIIALFIPRRTAIYDGARIPTTD